MCWAMWDFPLGRTPGTLTWRRTRPGQWMSLENLSKEKEPTALPSGVWCIGHDGEVLSVTDPLESHVPLHGFGKPTVVRVNLDLSAERLSFSDLLGDGLSHLHTQFH